MTEFTEPLFTIGDMGQLESSPGGPVVLPEPAPTAAGPNMWFAGDGQLDVRYTFLKDLVQGYVGRNPGFLNGFQTLQVNGIPMATSNSNIAALQATASGTSMTLATAPVQGIAVDIPIIPFTGVLGSLGTATSTTNAPIVLDYGFDWMALTNGSASATVTDSTLYKVGMPLCIAGTSASTTLLTNVASIVSATQITLALPALLTTAATPVGTGNAWGPSEFASSGPNSPYPVPTAALPYVAFGPGLFLDPRQSIARAVSMTASASTSTIANFVIAGWDVYWQPMTVTLGPLTTTSAALTFYTKKAFKAISSITPLATDASHSWSSGTSDMYGWPTIMRYMELTDNWWNGLAMASTTGFVAADFTSPASGTTGDVRGTIQVGADGSGGNNGQSGGASTGTVSSGSLTVTGKRLVLFGTLNTWDQLNNSLATPQFQTGRPQA